MKNVSSLKTLLILAFIFLLLAIFIFGYKQDWFNFSSPIDANRWGDFGVFIAGVFSFLAFIALLFTFYQQQQLSADQHFENSRSAKISLIQGLLSQKAKECYEMDIDKKTHAMRKVDEFGKENDGSVSHAVSNIITAWLLIRAAISNSNGYLNELDQVNLFDQFYLQLHTSIIDFVWKNDFLQSKDFKDQGRFHIGRQIAYCKELFIGPYSRYGNASPPIILNDVKLWKEKHEQAILKLFEINSQLKSTSDKLDGNLQQA